MPVIAAIMIHDVCRIDKSSPGGRCEVCRMRDCAGRILQSQTGLLFMTLRGRGGSPKGAIGESERAPRSHFTTLLQEQTPVSYLCRCDQVRYRRLQWFAICVRSCKLRRSDLVCQCLEL